MHYMTGVIETDACLKRFGTSASKIIWISHKFHLHFHIRSFAAFKYFVSFKIIVKKKYRKLRDGRLDPTFATPCSPPYCSSFARVLWWWHPHHFMFSENFFVCSFVLFCLYFGLMCTSVHIFRICLFFRAMVPILCAMGYALFFLFCCVCVRVCVYFHICDTFIITVNLSFWINPNGNKRWIQRA